MDQKFKNIIQEILDDKEFQKLNFINHHEGSRFSHAYNVAWISYQIAKKLKFNSIEVARAGLLHDFFLEDYSEVKGIKRIKLICNHGKIAKENAKRFNLTKNEMNIIESHMFPLGLVLPKSKEAILVSIVDKIHATYDFAVNIKYQYVTFFIVFFMVLRKTI